MTTTRDIIIKLKEVREEKNLSFNDIISLMEKNNDYIAKSTLSRVFAEGSEEHTNFKYEETIRPIAKALLDIENIEDDDTMDIKAMKSLLKYKMEKINELEIQVSRLESQLDKEQIKHHQKLEKEREQHRNSIEFLKHQIELKDKRMDWLLESVFKKDEQHGILLEQFISNREMLQRIIDDLPCGSCDNKGCQGLGNIKIFK